MGIWFDVQLEDRAWEAHYVVLGDRTREYILLYERTERGRVGLMVLNLSRPNVLQNACEGVRYPLLLVTANCW